MSALETVRNMKESMSRSRTSTSREIEFTFSAPRAKKVCVAGRFNDWNMTSMPMKKSSDGTWKIKVKLSPGSYEYKFVVDGTWSEDVTHSDTAPNSFGTRNNVVNVA
jgi:1,4-alpha-glucan branching enzyme